MGKRLLKTLAAALTALAVAAALCVLAASEAPQSIPYEVHEVPAAGREGQAGGEVVSDIDWEGLPPSVVAWVRVPGTTIDYPVVRASADEPSFYLDHDAEGRRSAWGTPYVDADCAEGLSSPLVVIYGHHMSDGTMFAPLASYSDPGFARDHRAVYVLTREGARELEVFAVDVVDASREGRRVEFEGAGDLKGYMASAREGCEVVLGELGGASQAWALVTCSYQTSNSRTVVYAKEVRSR